MSHSFQPAVQVLVERSWRLHLIQEFARQMTGLSSSQSADQNRDLIPPAP